MLLRFWRSSNRRSCRRSAENFVALRVCLRRAFLAVSVPVPVLVVGAGPVGLTLSILLSQYGVPSLVVDKRSRLSEHPQLTFSTIELWRYLGRWKGRHRR